MIRVDNLSVRFSLQGSEKAACPIRALDFWIEPGELVAIIGQSGAGKSLLAHALLGLLPHNAMVSGTISFHGRTLTPRELVLLRGRHMTLIPQTISALNPLVRIGKQIARAARLHGVADPWSAVPKALQRFQLDHTVARLFPFQLSGGMARRVLTAIATIGGAELIIADEPTNGLDPRTAQESLKILRQLTEEGKAVMLISHDIEAVLPMADRIVVFCAGMTIEEIPATDFALGAMQHPYSRALLAALPSRDFLAAIPPNQMGESGCLLASTCAQALAHCHAQLPPMRPAGSGRIRCWHHA